MLSSLFAFRKARRGESGFKVFAFNSGRHKIAKHSMRSASLLLLAGAADAFAPGMLLVPSSGSCSRSGPGSSACNSALLGKEASSLRKGGMWGVAGGRNIVGLQAAKKKGGGGSKGDGKVRKWPAETSPFFGVIRVGAETPPVPHGTPRRERKGWTAWHANAHPRAHASLRASPATNRVRALRRNVPLHGVQGGVWGCRVDEPLT